MARTQIDTSLIAALNVTSIGMGRNRVINGGMEIAQFAGGGNVTVNSNSDFYPADMFNANGATADGVFTAQRASTTPPTPFTNYLHAVVTTADASIGTNQYYMLLTRLEGYNLRDFELGKATAKTFTLSFWVRSSVTGTYGGSFANDAADRGYPFQYTISAANTWEFKTITIVGDITGTWGVTTGIGMRIHWGLGVGTDFTAPAGAWIAGAQFSADSSTNWISTNAATFDLTGVQLELGSRATPFEARPIQIEMILCQRYYEMSYGRDITPGSNSSGNRASLAFLKVNTNSMLSTYLDFKVIKRANPTMTFYTEGGTVGSWEFSNAAGTLTARAVSANNSGTTGVEMAQAVVENFYARGHWVADARL